MTAPMTWVMRPVGLAISSSLPKLCFHPPPERGKSPAEARRAKAWRAGSSQCFRARDDLDQFLGDHRLARAVVRQRLLANHFAGVAGGIVHRAHLRAVERRVVFEQRTKDLHGEILRQQ